METSQRLTHLSEKLRYQLEKFDKQLGLALLVIEGYIKMKVITADKNDKSTLFWGRSLYNFGWTIAFILYYLNAYKKFLTMIIHEFFSVLILKEKSWLSANEKTS